MTRDSTRLLRDAHAEALRGNVSGAREIVAAASSDARDGPLHACLRVLRAEALGFSNEGVERAVDLISLLADPKNAEDSAVLGLARAWKRLGSGELSGLADELREIEHQASAQKLAAGVVEAAGLRALALLMTDDPARGLDEARRAARMARTETIFELELLSALVLCRARRHSGRSHLAASIAAAARRFAPEPWRAWIEWELVLSGGVPDTAMTAQASLLRRAVETASTGDRDAWRTARDGLLTSASDWFMLRFDSQVVVGAIELDANETMLPESLVQWKRGEHDAAPFGITALASLAPDDGDAASAVAWVVAAPNGPARRVLRAGAMLETRGRAHRIEQLQRKQGRSDSTLAALFLAGPGGLAEEELFRKVYGFSFRPALHKDVLKLLLHRLRPRLGDLATLTREDGRVSLTPNARLVVADPRCSRPLDERVLALLASSGGLSAKDASRELGLPLRTTQAALEELVTEGVCNTQRNGRNIEYRVDDTTFEVPTRYRT